MNVIFEVRGREHVVNLKDAKRIINNLYERADQVYVNGKKIEVDQYDRDYIIKQLHGVIYV